MGRSEPCESHTAWTWTVPPINLTLGSAAVGVAGNFRQQSAESPTRFGLRVALLVGRDRSNQPKHELSPGLIAVPFGFTQSAHDLEECDRVLY